jgi:glucoamylase
MFLRRVLPLALAGLAAISPIGLAHGAAARGAAHGVAPGAPGAKADWAPADKHGFGTSRTTASKLWFTLEGADLRR